MDYIQKNIDREITKCVKRRDKLSDEIDKIDQYCKQLRQLEKQNAQPQTDSHEEKQENVHKDSGKGKP